MYLNYQLPYLCLEGQKNQKVTATYILQFISQSKSAMGYDELFHGGKDTILGRYLQIIRRNQKNTG